MSASSQADAGARAKVLTDAPLPILGVWSIGLQGVEKGEVAGASERLERGVVSGPVAGGEGLGDEGLNRAEHELGRLSGDGREQPVAHDLAVAGGAEHLAEPLELGAQALGRARREQRPERRERAAQPPRRHPHLVDGVLGA